MSGRGTPPIEPFGERTEPGENGARGLAYRFGYRFEGTKDVLSVIDIPAKIAELALTDGFLLGTKMTPTGISLRFSTVVKRSNSHQVPFGRLRLSNN
jgi:hypothetical protein